MERLYFRHRDWVYSLAMRFCRNESDAEDVLQDTFRYFFGKFPGFELRCQLRTFLYPAVRNRSLDLLKKNRRLSALTNGQAEQIRDTSESEDAGRTRVTEAVASLPEPQRDVVVLRFVDGLKLQEIAERLGIPSGTVKSRLHNALRALREQSD